MGDKKLRLELNEYEDGYYPNNLFRADLESSKRKQILDLLADIVLKSTGPGVSEPVQNCSKEPVVS